MNARLLLLAAALAGASGVLFGAFGAHALSGQFDPASLKTFETAVEYHLVHAVLIGFSAVALKVYARPAFGLAGWAFCFGILLFSFSLYALALGGPRWLAFATPVGGVCLVVGWLAIGYAALRADQP